MTTSDAITPIHPGEILAEECLAPLGVTQHRLAVAIGAPPRRINEIAHGTRRISADTALHLARSSGTSERSVVSAGSELLRRCFAGASPPAKHHSRAGRCLDLSVYSGPTRFAPPSRRQLEGREPGGREVGRAGQGVSRWTASGR